MKMIDKAVQLCKEWHEAGRAEFTCRYTSISHFYDEPSYNKKAVEKTKYICLDDGFSGAFICDKTDGNIYKLKSAYGVPNKKKLCGHIDTITAEDLQRLRWW